MQKKKQFRIFPAYSDRMIFIAVLLLVVYGSFMIASAEMGSAAGDTSVILRAMIRQIIFVTLGIIAMGILSRMAIFKIPMVFDSWLFFGIVVAFLLATRLTGPIGGAYGWIIIGPISVQPSEFVKVYVICSFAYILSKDYGVLENQNKFKELIARLGILVGVILVVQRDFGSALILAGIGYVILMSVPRKEFKFFQQIMTWIFLGVVALFAFLISPLGTDLLMNYKDHYQIARILTSANPFLYQYDDGYHLIMGLVSLATGGLFGLGYGNSIHKYMNFPNPSNDFILPVIVEEMGVLFGLLPILILYGIILVKLVLYLVKMTSVRSRLILLGTFMYLTLHFVLNVGGVSGLLPLTGVPLLLLSSGGSSTLAFMMAIGISQYEIIRFKKGAANARHSR